MGHSFVEFRGKHIFMNDMDIHWLLESISNQSGNLELPSSVCEFLDWWKCEGEKFGNGCIELPLDRVFADRSSLETIVRLLDQVAARHSSGISSTSENASRSDSNTEEKSEDQQRSEYRAKVAKRLKLLLLGQTGDSNDPS